MKNVEINIPIDDVYELLKEKYNCPNNSNCRTITKENWVGDQRMGHNEIKAVSIIINYSE